MRPDLLVHLAFHGVGEPRRALDPGEDAYWISIEFFTEILDDLAGQSSVAVSFDDGNASDVDIALPALRQRGLSASFFPIAARIGKPGCVDRAGLRSLAANGMSIGSHGMHHRPWRGLDRRTLDEELVEARHVIAAESGTPITAAACPLGSYDRHSLKRLRELGYQQVFTSDRSPAKPQAWLQPRYSVRRDDPIDDVRSIIGSRPDPMSRAVMGARIAAKRWR